MTTIQLTAESHKLFMEYAHDAGNWDGYPCVGNNVHMNHARNGNLTDLKKAGLVTTHKDEGLVWLTFTDKGIEYAAQHGITITYSH